MQVLTIIVPFTRSTSNVALSCKTLRLWLSNNGFPIRTSDGELCLNNFLLYKSLGCPDIDKWMRRLVWWAIKTDNTKKLKLLLQKGAYIESKDERGYTALILSAKKGRIECLKLLLGGKANIEAQDKDRDTALTMAAGVGQIECLNLLLQNKANIEAKNNCGQTALFKATIYSNLDCLQFILNNRANIEARNINGFSALYLASCNRKPDYIKVLLEHGAKVSPELREDYPQYSHLWENSTL